MQFLEEIKRRGVVRVAIAYLAIAWLVLQLAEMLLPVYGFSDTAIQNVVTLLGVGFLISLGFSWAFEWTPAGIVKDGDVSASPESAPRDHKKFDRFTILVLLVAVSFFVVDKFVLDPERDRVRELEIAETARNEALQGMVSERSIAVLAFEDLSPQSDQEYFSDGISEEILNLLTEIPELRVAGRTSAFSFKGKDNTIGEISKLLNVSHILEGSVRKAGQRVRITTQLLDARTDTHLWSETYDGDLSDVFAVQDTIAAQVVQELRVRLVGEVPTAPVTEPQAYENYLKARYIIYNLDDSRFDEAQALLDQALALAPDYLPALNMLWRLTERKSVRLTSEELREQLKAVTDRMNAIDPNNSMTLRNQAEYHFMFGDDPRDGVQLLERALHADPSDADTLRTTVYILMELGRNDEALAVARHLVAREPSCGICVMALFSTYRETGRYEEGANALLSLLNWGHAPPNFYWSLGVAWLGAGEPDKALEAFNREPNDVGEVWRLLAIYDQGNLEAFETGFQALREDPEMHPEVIARVYAYLGDADNAFKWLDVMFEQFEITAVPYFNTDIYNKIKSDPRWSALYMEHFDFDPEAPVEQMPFELPAGIISADAQNPSP